jgi:hypothetical protein
VKRSFRLVPNARFHGIPPLGFRFDCWYVVAVNSVSKCCLSSLFHLINTQSKLGMSSLPEGKIQTRNYQ